VTETPTLLRAVIDGTGLSRRKAFAAIRDGAVAVDGATAVDPSSPYTGGAITVEGAPVQAKAPLVHLLMNKPPGFLTTVSDPEGRRTVIDLVPVSYRVAGLHPVGRLDLDTSGLLILTNDGSLTYRLTHPSNEVEKEYWAGLRYDLTDAQLDELRAGVEIDSLVRRPAGIERLERQAPYQLAIRLREGRKRQVRRMIEAVGSHVVALRRVREGPLRLGNLSEGAIRPLTEQEVALLRDEKPAPNAAPARPRPGPRPPRRPGPRR
jgi:23S rRNA pseudouridine2605 synthase